MDCERFRHSPVTLYSRRKLKNIFPGEWESIYTGEGIEYAASKPYEPGDDLRDLDVQTLVQSGEEEIIQRVVGRQRQVYLWLDGSGSMQRSSEMFFACKPMIRDHAVGLLAFAAWHNYSPVGLCLFGRTIRRFWPARSGESYCEELVEGCLEHADAVGSEPADMAGAIQFMTERVAAQSLVLFISDFQDPAFEGDFTRLLRSVAKKFDFVPVVIRDPLEQAVTIQHPVLVAVRDSESHRGGELTLTRQRLAEIQERSARHLAHLTQNFRAVGLEHVVLGSASIEDCYRTLAAFFDARRRTRG